MQVVIAVPWTDSDGKKYAPDEFAELDDDTARTLVQDGWARVPTDRDVARSEGRPDPLADEQDDGGEDAASTDDQDDDGPHPSPWPAAEDGPHNTTDSPDTGATEKE